MSSFEPKIHIVVAMGVDRAIGADNKLMWKSATDMAHFRKTTTGRIVLAGYNTAVSLGRALPKRTNLVLTSREVPYEGMIAVRSLDEALAFARERGEDLYVIGGGKLYEAALPLAHVIHITTICSVFPQADTFFPVHTLEHFAKHIETTGYPPSDVDEYAGLISTFHTPRYYGSENPIPSIM